MMSRSSSQLAALLMRCVIRCMGRAPNAGAGEAGEGGGEAAVAAGEGEAAAAAAVPDEEAEGPDEGAEEGAKDIAENPALCLVSASAIGLAGALDDALANGPADELLGLLARASAVMLLEASCCVCEWEDPADKEE